MDDQTYPTFPLQLIILDCGNSMTLILTHYASTPQQSQPICDHITLLHDDQPICFDYRFDGERLNPQNGTLSPVLSREDYSINDIDCYPYPYQTTLNHFIHSQKLP